jgi:hydroxymethylpyrimidine pyrophosphatase-like HAD family hydrolase
LKKFLFVDLDDTLFQSSGKCGPDEELHPAAFLKDGTACSYTTARQRAFLTMAQREMTLIPATARNRDAFTRVGMSFTDYVIIDYGGVVLAPNGEPDEFWLAKMRAAMQAALPGLEQIRDLIDAYAERSGLGGKARIIEDFGVPFYVVRKDPEKRSEPLEQIERDVVAPWCEGEGKDFFIHRNGNNLAILPNALNKAHAVEYVRARLAEEHGEIVTFGMGDSKSDARFMSACDYAIVPNGTQLAKLTVAAL